MKINKTILALGATTAFLTSCLGPQTYFSEVFNTLYDTYFPTQDAQDRLNMNYRVDVEIVLDTTVYTFEVDFFESGLKLVQISPATVNGVETIQTLTLIYDYAEEGMFASRTYANNPTITDKVFEAFDDNSFDLFNEAVSVAEATLTEDIKGIINNQATNLVIGGQPADQDVKVYTLPVAQFVDLASFEDVAGFVPTDLTVKVTYTASTQAAMFEIDAASTDKTYSATVELSSPDGLVASDFLLSAEQKATYEGYTA